MPSGNPVAAFSTEEPAADLTGGDRSYPPSLTGLRGQYPGSFETAHRARDGGFGADTPIDVDTAEEYDLVIVGGGISGLAAAYFFQRDFGTSAKILIIDNHDDFGGHAKRNEFRHEGRLYLVNGGTLEHRVPLPVQLHRQGTGQRVGHHGGGLFRQP